jgi:Zn-dependent protease
MSMTNGPTPEHAAEQRAPEIPGPAAEVSAASTAAPIPPGGVIYKVDSSHATFAELWRDSRPSAVWANWLTKLLRIRLPGSVNDPNVEALGPFETEFQNLPPNVQTRMAGAVQNLGTLGFDALHPICHAIVDRFNNSRTYLVSLVRPDGRAVARVVMRSEGSASAPRTHFYREFLTELSNGEFLWTTSAKATLSAPAGIHIRRHLAAAAPVLWEAHQKALAQSPGVANAQAAATPAGARALLERHHALLRDFHLGRGLFSPMSGADLQLAGAIDATYAQASAGGLAFPEIVAEVERLQHRTSSRLGGAVVLVISLLMFILLGVGGKSGWTAGPQARRLLLILVPVLFFHELGHYLAMRVFRYRNVRMFFIPMFGAAVSGTNYSAPGWKKVVVALMGPLPGILLGAVLGSLGIVLHNSLLIEIALMSLILNGSNLIPVLPLDGGRVVQTLLFSRHYAVDGLFRALAAGALILAGIKIPERILLFLGIMMLLGIPLILRRGRVAAELRRAGFGPSSSDDQRIPPGVADAIIARLKGGAARKVKQTNKAVAQSTLAVYELLCNRPPGWLASIGFGIVHVSAIALAAILAVALFAAKGGSLAALARSAAAAPKLSISPSQIETAGEQQPSVERRTIVANFPTLSEARSAYASIVPALGPGEAIERFGQTLLIAFPAKDDSARKRHLAEIEQRTRTFSVSGARFGGAMLRLTCVAPDELSAERIRDEVQGYLDVPTALHLIPPWSPEAAASGGDWNRFSLARSTYRRLLRAGQTTPQDPGQKDLSARMQEALRRGDNDEYKRIVSQQVRLFAQRRQDDLNRLRAINDGTVDQLMVENYTSLPQPTGADDDGEGEGAPALPDYKSPAYQAMARRMGQLPLVDGRPTPAATRFSTEFGSILNQGAALNLPYWSFDEPIEGAAALINWLYRRGCSSMRYEFKIPDASAKLPE